MRRRRIPRCAPGLLLALCTGLATAQPGAEVEPITVHFHNRPPYMLPMPDGSPAGITGSVAKAAFAAARLPVRWAETPAARQLLLIEANGGRDCGIGWFRNAKREQFARFTAPLYRDLPWAALVGPRVPLQDGVALAQLLSNRELRLLVKDKYSYGGELDGRIAQFPGETVTTTGDWMQVLGLLRLSRADFMFASHEEAQYLLASAGPAAEGLRIVTLAGAPPGEFRHLMCSRRVSEDEIAALDVALAALKRGR